MSVPYVTQVSTSCPLHPGSLRKRCCHHIFALGQTFVQTFTARFVISKETVLRHWPGIWFTSIRRKEVCFRLKFTVNVTLLAFKCVSVDCGMTYVARHELQKHAKAHEGGGRSTTRFRKDHGHLGFKCLVSKCRAKYNSYHSYAAHLAIKHNCAMLGSTRSYFKKGHKKWTNKRTTLASVYVADLERCPVCEFEAPSMHQMLRHIRDVHPAVGKGQAPCDELTPHIKCLECQQCIPFSAALYHATKNCPSIANPELRSRKQAKCVSTIGVVV